MLRSLGPSRSSLRLVIIVACMSSVGCGGNNEGPMSPESAGREITIQIPLSKVAAAAIASAAVVVSAPDMAEIVQPLVVSGTLMTGVVTGIPVGSGRLFTINAYDANNTLSYTGSATEDVVAGGRVRVEIALHPASSPAPGPTLAVRGIPQVTQGDDYGGSIGWKPSIVGDDARITGEIENAGAVNAAGVSITVTLRDAEGNLLGRVRDHSVGTIQAGDSELFAVVIPDTFSDTRVIVAALIVEVEIGG